LDVQNQALQNLDVLWQQDPQPDGLYDQIDYPSQAAPTVEQPSFGDHEHGRRPPEISISYRAFKY
jgi:hypothetical protein